MKTIDELKAAVETAEGVADRLILLGQLKGRVAGIKTRYASLNVAVPPEVTALDADVDSNIAASK